MREQKIMGHLAQWGSFVSQGELLCTQGLCFLLRDPGASSALAAGLTRRTGIELSGDLEWQAEVRQDSDGGRPDLEALADGMPVVKIEAKLGAELDEGQLMSYCGDLQERSGKGALVVLIPQQRFDEAKKLLDGVCQPASPGRWHSAKHPGVEISIVTWKQVFDILRGVAVIRDDLAQLEGMCKVLLGNDIMPFARDVDLLEWHKRKTDLVNIVERATRELTRGHHRVYPMGEEALLVECESDQTRSYHRRYFCRTMGDLKPCFSVGVRDPFAEDPGTPIWMRIAKVTPGYLVLHERLSCSDLRHRIVVSEGHTWLPLDVPPEAELDEMVSAIVTQAETVIRIAIPPQG